MRTIWLGWKKEEIILGRKQQNGQLKKALTLKRVHCTYEEWRLRLSQQRATGLARQMGAVPWKALDADRFDGHHPLFQAQSAKKFHEFKRRTLCSSSYSIYDHGNSPYLLKDGLPVCGTKSLRDCCSTDCAASH